MVNEKPVEKLKKFFINKKVKDLVIIVAVVILIAYISLKALGTRVLFVDIISEMLLIAFSIITTTLFTSWLVETKTRNDIYADFICNDFLGSKAFYNNLEDKNKKALLQNLEREFYFSGSAAKEKMYNSITAKINGDDKVLYLKCRYDIDCTIVGGVIRKSITRTTEICGHEQCKLNDLPLISVYCGTIDGENSFKLTELKINDTEYDVEKTTDRREMDIHDDNLLKCGYNKKISYSLKKKLSFPKFESSKKGIKITLRYDTVVSENESSYVCRVKYPCKSFSLNFRLLGDTSSKYALSAHPFGFIETGNNTGNNNNRSSVNIDFNDWIFANDGVCVVISNKKQNL